MITIKSNNIFAVDIGGSKLICGIVTNKGEILDTYRVDFKKISTLDDVSKAIKEGFKRLDTKDLKYCGVTVPGLCDAKSGSWLYSPFSGIENVPIAQMINEITGLTVYADNDVNVCAVGEKHFGSAKTDDDFLWITVSNGIGGALYLNGRLYSGANFTAGEIGHFIVEEQNGEECGCGNFGCLEAMASGASISKIYNKITNQNLTTKEIAELAKNGDKNALEVFEKAGFYIGKAIATSVNLLGLNKVVLGGGVSENFDLLIPFIEKSFNRFVFKKANPNTEIIHSKLGYYAALKGCAAIVNENIKE